MPMRPAEIAARMSRSDRTTGPEDGRASGGDGPGGRAEGAVSADGRAVCSGAARVRASRGAREGRGELVIRPVDVLETGVHDLDPRVVGGVAFCGPLEDLFADPLGGALGHATLAE